MNIFFVEEKLNVYGKRIFAYNAKRHCYDDSEFRFPAEITKEIQGEKKDKNIISDIKKALKSLMPLEWNIYFVTGKRYADRADLSVPERIVLEEYEKPPFVFSTPNLYEAMLETKRFIRYNSQINLNIDVEIHAYSKKEQIEFLVYNKHDINYFS